MSGLHVHPATGAPMLRWEIHPLDSPKLWGHRCCLLKPGEGRCGDPGLFRVTVVYGCGSRAHAVGCDEHVRDLVTHLANAPEVPVVDMRGL